MKCTCGRRPKCVYEDKHEAKRIAAMMSRATGDLIEPYRCPYCRQWCVGHKPHANKRAFDRLVAQKLRDYGTQ